MSVAAVDGSGFRYTEPAAGDASLPVLVSVGVHPTENEPVVISFAVDSTHTTATSGEDYRFRPVTCVVPPGASGCVAEVVSILPDGLVEPVAEVVALSAVALDGEGLPVSTSRIRFQVLILDDDSPVATSTDLESVRIAVFPTAVQEPQLQPEVVPFTVTVEMEPPTGCEDENAQPADPADCEPPDRLPLHFRWWTSSGTAVGGDGTGPIDDYRTSRGQFFVPAEQFAVHGNVSVELFPDDLVEGDEQFLLHLSVSDTPHFHVAAHFTLAVAIIDSSTEQVFGQLSRPGGGALVFREADPEDPPVPVEILVPVESPPLVEELVINYGVQALSGSAEPGIDYRPFSGAATVPLGHPAAVVRFAEILGDDVPEPLEAFEIWVEISGRPYTRVIAVVEIEDDEVLVNDPGFVTLEFGGLEPPFAEGDGPRPGIPLLLRLVTPEPQSEELVYHLVTIDGTARAGEDFEALDVELRFRQGELVSFDPSRPLRLAIVGDRVPEADEEYFYFSLSARLPGLDYPLFSQLVRVGIVDDDHVPAVLSGQSSLWLGAVSASGCPGAPRPVEVHEPPPGSAPVLVRLPVYARLVPVATAEEGVCNTPTVAFEADYRLDRPLVGFAATLGADVSLARRDAATLLFAPVDHVDVVEVLVYADELLEPDEAFSVRVSAGVHGEMRVPMVIVDHQKADALRRGRDASFVRLGRMIGSTVTDALSARFSCARSAGCSDPGRSDPVPIRNLVSRLAAAATPFGGSLSGSGVPTGSRLQDPDPSLYRAFESTRLEIAGRLLDDIGFQTSPSAWLPVRNPDAPNPWSTWFRTDYLAVSDTDPAGNRLETDMLAFTGGVDRRLGMLNVGLLYSFAQASYGRAYEPLLARAEGVEALEPAFRMSGAWHLLAPYIGVTPHERFRAWSTFGFTLAGAFSPAQGGSYRPVVDEVAGAPSYQVVALGTSLTALRASSFIVDLEADAFQVGARLPEPGFADRSGRLRPARRGRVAVRVGVPLDFTSVKRVTFGVGRRWDEGPDLEWLRASSGAVGHTELLFDIRFAALRSRFSAAVGGRVQLTGWNEPSYRSPEGVPLRGVQQSAEHAVAAALRWGVSETPDGWSIVLRPTYGYPGIPGGIDPARSVWYGAFSPRHGGVSGFPAAVDLEAHYVWRSGGRLVVSGSRPLVDGPYPSVRPAAGVRFDHAW